MSSPISSAVKRSISRTLFFGSYLTAPGMLTLSSCEVMMISAASSNLCTRRTVRSSRVSPETLMSCFLCPMKLFQRLPLPSAMMTYLI